MTMKLKVYFLIIGLFLGCSEPEEVSDFLSDPGFFIKAEVDGEEMRFGIDPPFPISVFQTAGDNPNNWSLSLTKYHRTDISSSRYFRVRLARFDLDTLEVPWESAFFPNLDEAFATVIFGNNAGSVQPFSQLDSVNYKAEAILGDNVRVVITDKTDDIVTGSFHATAKTQTGRVKEITNGEFRVKVGRVNI